MSNKCELYRNFDILTYLTELQLKLVLDAKLSQIYRYAYIFHDKDSGKEPHWHLFLVLKSAKSINSIRTWFDGFIDSKGLPINTRVRVENYPLRAIRYLIHLDDEDKFCYDIGEVRTYNLDYEREISKRYVPNVRGDNLSTATLFLYHNGLNSRNILFCIESFGRDFILAYKNIKSLVQDLNFYDSAVQRGLGFDNSIDLDTGVITYNPKEVMQIEIALDNSNKNNKK